MATKSLATTEAKESVLAKKISLRFTDLLIELF